MSIQEKIVFAEKRIQELELLIASWKSIKHRTSKENVNLLIANNKKNISLKAA